jgi:COX assembly protein 2
LIDWTDFKDALSSPHARKCQFVNLFLSFSPSRNKSNELMKSSLILTLSTIPTDCEEIMIALDECHARGFLWKALGQCNDIKREVNRCLGAERLERAKRNREKARENRSRIEKIWAEERAKEGAEGEQLRQGQQQVGSASA